jgi:hypothetical protein
MARRSAARENSARDKLDDASWAALLACADCAASVARAAASSAWARRKPRK